MEKKETHVYVYLSKSLIYMCERCWVMQMNTLAKRLDFAGPYE